MPAEPDSASRPGRLSREESRALTRARLLEAAGAAFAERGYHGASVEEITERAGYSRGAFYSNFQTKDDLFLAVLDAHIELETTALNDALTAEATTPGALLEFLQVRAVRRSGEARQWTMLWAEFWLHVVRHPELAPRLAARQHAGRTAIAQVIATRAEQLGMDLSVPADQAASIMMAVDDGLVMQEYLDPTGVPEDLRALAAVVLFRGMALGTEGT
jgi:AcrR family transcriptional regulator